LIQAANYKIWDSATTDSVFELVYQSLFTMAIYIDLFIIPSYPADPKTFHSHARTLRRNRFAPYFMDRPHKLAEAAIKVIFSAHKLLLREKK